MKKMLWVVLLASCLVARADTYYSNSDFTQPYTVDARTLGLWHLDDSAPSTNTVDSGANNCDGYLLQRTYNQLDSNKTWAASMSGFGNAARGYWASASDYNYGNITVTNALPIRFGSGQDFTIEFWIKTDGFGYSSGSVIISKYTGADLGIFQTPSNTVGFACYSGGWRNLQSSAVYPVGEWTHVAATFDRTTSGTVDTVKIYFSGELVDTLVTPGWKFPVGTSNPFYFMNRSDAHGNYQLRGYLDEIRFSDTLRFPVPPMGTLLTVH